MPKTIILEDGTEETVYSESEVTPLKESATKAEELGKQFDTLKKEMGVGDGQTIEEKLAELKESANPNFGKYRAKYTSMEKELKAAGKEFADDGSIITDKQISREEILKAAQEAAISAVTRQGREDALKQFTPEEKKVVEYYLDKLEATGGKFEENFELAIRKALPDRANDIVKNSSVINSGQGPRIDTTKKSFTDTDEGKALLEELTPKK